MSIEIFGVTFGGNGSSSRTGKTIKEYNIPKKELLDELNIEGKPKFISYDWKKGVLHIKVEEE